MRILCVMLGLLVANTALAKPKKKPVVKKDENSWVSDPSLKTYCEKRIDAWRELRFYIPYVNPYYCNDLGPGCETDRMTKLEYRKQKLEEVATYRHFAEDSTGRKLEGDFANGQVERVPEECCKVMPERFEHMSDNPFFQKGGQDYCLYKR